MNPAWVILSSHYLNAWGLADLIRATGRHGRLVCLRRDQEPFVLMSLYGRGVELWKVPGTVGLMDFLAERIPSADRKCLFFTEERSLVEISAAKGHPWLATATWYPGEQCRLHEILDRFLFCDRIACKGLGNVPRTVSGESDPFTEFGNEFFFRYRITWVCGKQTPRIRLIKGRAEWQGAVRAGEQQGYGPADWCYQEVLSLAPQDNVSVCGWHDSNNPRYVATRKVLQFPERQGNGDVCELIELPATLADATRHVLEDLSYTGPFELEYVRDFRTGQFCMIELNPRFWMQHPLAGGNLGQALVRRYLGLPDETTPNRPSPRYWVNTIVALHRLLHADFRSWRYLHDPQAIRVPPVTVTMRWLARFSVNLALRQRSGGRHTLTFSPRRLFE